MINTQFVRTTAILTIGASLLGIAAKLALLGSPTLADTANSGAMTLQILSALAFALVLAGLFGLWRSGATGSQRIGISGLALAVIGQVIAAVLQFQYSNELGLAAALTVGVGMLLVAVAVIQTGRWRSWRRYAPLICVLSVPLAAFLFPVLFETMGINGVIQVTGAFTLLSWLLVGIALWIETGPVSSASPQTAA